MTLTESAKLIYTTFSQDGDGFPIEAKTELEVLVDKKDVFDNAKFSAMANGVNVTIMFELWEDDFEMTKTTANGKHYYADHIEYNGVTYKILNHSTADNSRITRLTCE